MTVLLKRRYTHLLLAIGCWLLAVGCTSSDVTDSAPGAVEPAADVAVTFDSYLQRTAEGTRATYPDATWGVMDNSKLQATSFGVFAHYTGSSTFDYDAAGNGAVPYNFMWNQQVEYSDDKWTYNPVKYWPNDNREADKDGATGSQEHSYVSFFGYAPYIAAAELPSTAGEMAAADGIIYMTGNTAAAGKGTEADKGSYLTYRTNSTFPYDPDDNVDLLWAGKPNCYKMDDAGYGYVNGRVNLLFKHAQSLFTITVQGLFDHADNDDDDIHYADDRDMYTHILVDKVEVSPLFEEGNMYFAPRPDDATVPYWEMNTSRPGNITVDGAAVNSTISNTYVDGTEKKRWDDTSAATMAASFLHLDDGAGADDALALFNALPKGVSHEEVPLLDRGEYYYMVLPNKDYLALPANSSQKMTVHMVYYVITYDERLELPKEGYPKYFSIVKNDVTATLQTFAFEPNKKYKLRLQPGLTTVKFEVSMVDGWDTPITLNPEVVDWVTVTKEYDVE